MAIVLLAGCNGDADGEDPTEPGQAEGEVDDDEAAGPADPSPGNGTRTTTYIGTHWTVHDARASSEPPDGSDPDDDTTFVYVPVEVENTLEETSLRLPGGMFLLRSDDGEVSRSEGLLQAELESRLRLEPGEVVEGDLVFAFERTVDPADLTLTIEESGKQPAVLPLAGEVPAPPHATDGQIVGDRQTATTVVGAGTPPEVEIEPLGVTFGLDHGSTRSDAGTYFVVLDVRVHGLTPRTSIGGGLFRLEVDGVPRSHEDRQGGTFVGEGEAVDQLVVFEVPVDADELELVAGQSGEQQARYPITFEPPAEGGGTD